MKNIRTGLMIVALTTAIGSTTTFAQQGAGSQGAGAGAEMGGAVQTEHRTSKAPLLGLLGLLGLMGLKRHNERYADDRR